MTPLHLQGATENKRKGVCWGEDIHKVVIVVSILESMCNVTFNSLEVPEAGHMKIEQEHC